MAGDGYSADTAFEWPAGGTRVVGNTATRGPGVPAFGVDWWRVRLRAGQAYRVQMRRPSFGPEDGGYRYVSIYQSLVQAQGNSYYSRSYRYGEDGTYFPSIDWTPPGVGMVEWWVKVDDGSNGNNGYRGEYTLEITPAPAPWPTVHVAGGGGTSAVRGAKAAALLYPEVTPGGTVTVLGSTPYDYSWSCVAWGAQAGRFVAMQSNNNSNNVMTSPDGVAWTIGYTGTGSRFNAVCWSPELRRFVAFDCYYNNYVYYSADGVNWSYQPVHSYGLYVSSLAWSAELGLFAAVLGSSYSNAFTSPDGINWTLRNLPAQYTWRSVCWSGELGLFVAVGAYSTTNQVMTSPDGINWTLRASAANQSWQGVCWSPEVGLFVAVASSGTGKRVMTSPDGLAWTLRQTPIDSNWRSVCWAPEPGLFLAVAETGTGNRAMTSADGIEWRPHATPADNNWTAVCWSPERRTFAAVATSGSGNRAFAVRMTPRVDEGFHAIRREGVSGAEQNVRVRSFVPVKPLGVRALVALKRDNVTATLLRPRHALRTDRVAALLHADVPNFDPLQNPKAEELIAAWPMEEDTGTRVELSPRRWPLAMAGTVTAQPGVNYANAASFPASQASYLHGPNPFSGLPDNAGTMSFWVRPNDVSYQVLLASGTESPLVDRWAFLLYSGGTLRHYTYNAAGSNTGYINGGSVSAGVWTHIALRWNAGRRDLFRNGAYQNYTTDTEADPRNGALLRVGACFNWNNIGYNPYNGLLDELYCWSRALSDAEIAQLYANGAGLFVVKEAGEEPAGGYHRIHETNRAFIWDRHRLDATGERCAVHAAGWRVFDGTFTHHAASRHSILYPRRHHLFVRDTATGVEHDLGVAEENPDTPGTFTLADVPLADGVYEVEARSTDTLWADARSRRVFTFRLRSGEAPAVELPAVVNLHAGLTSDWWRVLTWSVAGAADTAGDTAFQFGVWFGQDTNVDISGPPAATLPRARGLDHYEYYFQQIAPRWVAVAAYASEARGQPAMLFLPWDEARPDAPARQWAEENRESSARSNAGTPPLPPARSWAPPSP